MTTPAGRAGDQIVDRDPDLGAACAAADHESCNGYLTAQKGPHWWCVCTCHPAPDPTTFRPAAAARRAVETWRAGRARVAAAAETRQGPSGALLSPGRTRWEQTTTGNHRPRST